MYSIKHRKATGICIFAPLFRRRVSCVSRSPIRGCSRSPGARRAELNARECIATRTPFARFPPCPRSHPRRMLSCHFLPLPCHGRGEGHGARPQSSMSSVLRLPPTRGVLIRSCFATEHAPLRRPPPAQARRKGRAPCPSPRPVRITQNAAIQVIARHD